MRTLTLTDEQHDMLCKALVNIDTHIVFTTDGDEPVNYDMDMVQELLCFERVS